MNILSVKGCKCHAPRPAYPAAEEASPAAVGKLFFEQTWTFQSRKSSVFPSARAISCANMKMKAHIQMSVHYNHNMALTEQQITRQESVIDRSSRVTKDGSGNWRLEHYFLSETWEKCSSSFLKFLSKSTKRQLPFPSFLALNEPNIVILHFWRQFSLNVGTHLRDSKHTVRSQIIKAKKKKHACGLFYGHSGFRPGSSVAHRYGHKTNHRRVFCFN